MTHTDKIMTHTHNPPDLFGSVFNTNFFHVSVQSDCGLRHLVNVNKILPYIIIMTITLHTTVAIQKSSKAVVVSFDQISALKCINVAATSQLLTRNS